MYDEITTVPFDDVVVEQKSQTFNYSAAGKLVGGVLKYVTTLDSLSSLRASELPGTPNCLLQTNTAATGNKC